MRINADFSQAALVAGSDDNWVRSPESGVDRLMLDRVGDEVARATSIVRYAPGSSFPEHSHAKGEEFLVLDGVFSDESGDYPTGTYVRNPPGSSHTPYSVDGCRILVKLRQFDPVDLAHVVVDSTDETLWENTGDGSSRLALHTFGNEHVEMRRLGAGQSITVGEAPGGAEVLVVNGTIGFDDYILTAESWLRIPDGQGNALSAQEPSTLWLKSGHLADL